MREYYRSRYMMRRIARWLVGLAVVVSPWLYASAEPWAFLFLSIVIMAGASIWLLSVISYPFCDIRSMPLVLASCVLVLFLAFQSIPQVKAFTERVSPVSVAIQEKTDAVFSDANIQKDESSSSSGFVSISVARSSTIVSMFLIVACLAIFFVMANTIRSWMHLKQVVTMMLVSGFLLALISIIHHLSGSNSMMWLRTSGMANSSMFGPFSNRNHYAFYMLMIFSVAFGMFLAVLGPVRSGWIDDWRERLASFTTKSASKMVLLAFVMLVTGGSIFLSLSRGGMSSLLAGLGAVGAVTCLAGDRPSYSRGLLCGSVFLIAGIVWIGGEGAIDRMATLFGIARDPLGDTRVLVTRDTFEMYKAFPLFGSGFGTYRHIFGMFQSQDVQFGRFIHAHNDWMQLLAEGGVVGMGIFVTMIYLVFHDIKVRIPFTNREERKFLMGLATGIIAVALHSLVDFSIHKPANAFLLSAILGVSVAAVHMSRGPVPVDELPEQTNGSLLKLPIPVKRIFLCVLLAGVVVVMCLEANRLRGELAFARLDYARKVSEKLDKPSGVNSAILNGFREFEVIRRFAQQSPRVMGESSVIFFQWALNSGLESEVRVHIADEAAHCAKLAVENSPSDYLSWLNLARTMALNGKWSEVDLFLARANALRPQGEEMELGL